MSVTINGTSGVTFNDASNQTTAATGFGFKNRIINGAMVIDQRNAGASVTAYSAYTTDRWFKSTSGSAQSSFQQVSDAPTGFVNSLKFTVTATDAASIVYFGQRIEGLNVSDLAFGSSSASTITLSFWVKSSLTGTYSVVAINSAANRSYVATYAVNSSNTWEQKTITIAGDTTGTWLTTNGVGIELRFALASGGTTQAVGSWGTANATCSSTQTNWANNASATFQITGVQLEKGSTATSFDYRPYGTELALCQRYYWRPTNEGGFISFGAGVVAVSTTLNRGYTALPVKMRAAPTLNFTNIRIFDGTVASAVTSIADNFSTTNVGSYQIIASSGGLTIGRAAMLIEGSTSLSFLDFTAEL